MDDLGLILKDVSERRFEDILENHGEEARKRVSSLLAETVQDENGCLVFGCKTPRKVRFWGERYKAYRFIFCILNRLAASEDVVIRHRCDNRLCVNPAHLEPGTHADNWRDFLEHRANGVDFRLL